MPYTPGASAAQYEQALEDANTVGRPTLTLIQGGASEVSAAGGATAGATAAAEAGGVAGVDSAVASVAAVPLVGELALAGYAGYRLGMGLRSIPGWDQAMHRFGGGIASVLGFAPPVSFSVPDNVKFYVADRIQHYSIVNAQANAGMYSQLQGQLLHLTHLSRALATTAVAINRGARLHDTQTLQQSQNYANGQALRTAAYANTKAAQTLQAANAYARAQALQADAHANTVARAAQTNAQTYANARINTLEHALPELIKAGAGVAVAAALRPVLDSLKGIESRLKPLEQEAEECTKPMCDNLGPNTDWGKFFTKFKEAAFFAALAEFAGADVGDVESAATRVAEALGPVLQAWMEAYVGILPGGTSKSPGIVTDTIGQSGFGL